MVLGNTERLSQLFIVEAAQAGRDGGDAEPVPGAGRMVIGDSRVQRNAGAPGDFIPNDQRRQRFPAPLRSGRDSASAASAGTTATPMWPLVGLYPSWPSRLSICVAQA
jgi:hypothetical protein